MPPDVVVLGATGRIARQRHLTGALLPLQEAGAVGRILLAGRDPNRLHAVADECGLPRRECITLNDALAKDGPDVVLVATPTGTHAELGRRAIEHGKHLMIEKPVAMTSEDAWSLVRQAREAGVCATMVADKAFSAGFQRLRERVATGSESAVLAVSGEFGYFVDSGVDPGRPPQRPSWNYRRNAGGSITHDLLSHWAYMLEIVGRPEAVQALAATRVRERVDESGRPYIADVPDWLQVAGYLEGGIPFSINNSWVRRPAAPFSMTVDRENDSLRARVSGLQEFRVSGSTIEEGRLDGHDDHEGPARDEFLAQWEAFLSQVDGGAADVEGLAVGARASDFVEAAERSIETGVMTRVRKGDFS